MIHASTPGIAAAPSGATPGDGLASGAPSRAGQAGQAGQVERMPTDLRALALCLAGPFAGLSPRARRCLALRCDGFAELLEAQGTLPDAADELRSWPRFLLSALFALRSAGDAPPLSEQDEAWMVAEVEADFGEALALFEVRTGRPRSPIPPRPPLSRRELAC
ncbi:hypothetical protein WMF04_05815 [Sorangium sp. So ce260]|uniref:hypothetical protein n=1 Tax=Sorangium sp. So ce260 TaxID=3133291 RepID=UPI003F5E75CA